ncbi:MAG TPA: type II toxin-antitoxin system mRNA interferase toxin, RelE/StbE family [Candidatus Paceibacterota bacterium]
MRVEYSDRFLKSTARLPAKLLALADTKEALFKQQPFHSSLDTHKLHGKDKDTWAFSINQKYRIKFLFLPANAALFLDIGTHSIYD